MNKKRTNAPASGKGDPQLATEQFSELNATFYSSAPHDYLRARMQSIAFTLTDAAEAEQILQAEPQIGSLFGGPSARLPEEARLRFGSMESTVLLHHAGESLLRLWLAHRDSPPCPWLKVAGLRNGRKLKEEAEELARKSTSAFNRGTIAAVFLGGRTIEESGIEAEDDVWNDSIDGLIELLRAVADRFTSESEMYNAVKHGLVGIPANHGDFTVNGLRVAGGAGITYLQSVPEDERYPSGERSWWATTGFIGIESNILLVELTTRAIHSLWNVGRRARVGIPGEIALVTRDEVFTGLAASYLADKRLLSDISQKLPTYTYGDSGKRALSNASVRPNAIRLGVDVLEAHDRLNGSAPSTTFLELPLRERDRRIPSGTGDRRFFHFSPSGGPGI